MTIDVSQWTPLVSKLADQYARRHPLLGRDDLVQEGLLVVWRRAGEWDGRQAMEKFLSVQVSNRFVDLLRSTIGRHAGTRFNRFNTRAASLDVVVTDRGRAEGFAAKITDRRSPCPVAVASARDFLTRLTPLQRGEVCVYIGLDDPSVADGWADTRTERQAELRRSRAYSNIRQDFKDPDERIDP